MFSKIVIDYYGTPTPLTQMASIAVPEPRMAIIKPYDAGQLAAMEKAIRDSDLGVNPNNEGTQIRIVLPQMTEERRREMIKVARHKGEEAKVAVRNVRRKAKEELDRIVKDGEAGEDDGRRAEKELDDLTHKYVGHDRRAHQAQGSRAARGLMTHLDPRPRNDETADLSAELSPGMPSVNDRAQREPGPAEELPRSRRRGSTAAVKRTGRAGRNLPAAIGVGVSTRGDRAVVPVPLEAGVPGRARRRRRRRHLGDGPRGRAGPGPTADDPAAGRRRR